jgi:SAM-dependent methyltransferase
MDGTFIRQVLCGTFVHGETTLDTTEPERRDRLERYLKRWGPGYPSPKKEIAWAGTVQPNFLKKNGLQPGHMFLDLGCGWLRGTMALVDFLEQGNFYGADISRASIEKAKKRTMRHTHHKPNLAVVNGFEVSRIWPKVRFDFILAASLFTHLYPSDLRECLRQVSKVLKGKFFATIFKDNTLPIYGGWCGSCVDHREDHTNMSRDVNLEILDFCFNTSWISRAAGEFGLRINEIGPTEIGQFMLEISPAR